MDTETGHGRGVVAPDRLARCGTGGSTATSHAPRTQRRRRGAPRVVGHSSWRSRSAAVRGPLCVATAAALLTLSPLSAPGSSAAAIRASAAGACGSGLARVEPSRQAPPGRRWLRGFVRVYCNDFTGSSLPWGWGKFSGVPQGDPSGYFDPSHVVVGHGVLSLLTARDPAHGGAWATGGVCQCGVGRRYGVYLVRSRVTGPGDDEVQMLWPVAHVWPPEVDFNEAGRTTKTAWYVHFRSTNRQIARTLRINLARWHTWGVRWSPHRLTFTVDGAVWGTVTAPAAIPHVAMTLDFSQQTWCGVDPDCPRRPVSMQIDWVAEFVQR